MQITEDKPCCDVFLKIAHRFEWFKFSDQPEMLAMPSFKVGSDQWRINFCPACGKEVRSINLKRETIGL